MRKLAILGAGGKMGCRVTANLFNDPNFDISFIEISEGGRRRLKESFGVNAVDNYDSLADADAVIFAVPDILIQKISAAVIPVMKAGATVIGLDPAAHYGKTMMERDDLKYFVVHPCHPPLFNFEEYAENLNLEAQKDWFGGVGLATMDLVCAIYNGTEEDKKEYEDFARKMFRPVNKCFWLTIEQMVMLEPALVESITTPLVKGIRMAVDACVEQGVPRDAVMAFVMGHLKVQFGVIFDYAGFPFSDGANLAARNAMDVIFKPNWIENIMCREAVDKSVYDITHELNE